LVLIHRAHIIIIWICVWSLLWFIEEGKEAQIHTPTKEYKSKKNKIKMIHNSILKINSICCFCVGKALKLKTVNWI
jgi:hypothetical protein